jgi:hypothetical protein
MVENITVRATAVSKSFTDPKDGWFFLVNSKPALQWNLIRLRQ